MSQVTLLACAHPLPLYVPNVCRISSVLSNGKQLHVETPGFSVQEHRYYRSAVEALALPMKPFLYELNLSPTEQDACLLRAYLSAHCLPGELVELWCLWVGMDSLSRLHRFHGHLSDLETDTLKQLEEQHHTCMTISI